MKNFKFKLYNIFVFPLFYISLTNCAKENNVKVDLYQVYYETISFHNYDRPNYIDLYYLIINNTTDSVNVQEIGNNLSIVIDTSEIRKIENGFIYREFKPFETYLQKDDTVFLIRKVYLRSFNRSIKEKLKSYVDKSRLNNYSPNVNYIVNPNIKYYFGERRPYYMSKQDTLIAQLKDDDMSYYEGLLQEYQLFYK